MHSLTRGNIFNAGTTLDTALARFFELCMLIAGMELSLHFGTSMGLTLFQAMGAFAFHDVYSLHEVDEH